HRGAEPYTIDQSARDRRVGTRVTSRGAGRVGSVTLEMLGEEAARVGGERLAVSPQVAPDRQRARQRRVNHLGGEGLEGDDAVVVDLTQRREELIPVHVARPE